MFAAGPASNLVMTVAATDATHNPNLEEEVMKAIVWHGVGDIRLDDVPDARIQDEHDAVVEVTTSAICGTDLHFIRGTMSGMAEGTILGHEAVGIVREVGPGVRNLAPR